MLEDVVVFVRCLVRKMGLDYGDLLKDCLVKSIEEVIDEYVNECRMRLVGFLM